MIEGTIAGLLSAALCYVCMRRSVTNFGDPVLFVNISIPFSAALLSVLCFSQLVVFEKLIWFFLILSSYLIGIRCVAAFSGREGLRAALKSTVGRFSKNEIAVLLVVTTLLTLLLAFLAILAGGQGDARQDFNRAFRPIVTLHSGLFCLALVSLLSPKLSKRRVSFWLIMIVVPSLAYGGKSVFLPVFFWFGLRYFIEGRTASWHSVLLLVGAVFIGVTVMGVLAYGVSSMSSAVLLITNRLWLSGDVYIYAYQMDGLDMVRSDYRVTFISYILHPITSIFGVRGYEKPLGSILASQLSRSDVLTGPNPQLPVLLDYFFPSQVAFAVLIAFVIGFLTMAIRNVGMWLAKGRSRYLALGGMAMAIFSPAAGFVDTSLVLISLVSIGVATAFLVVSDLALFAIVRTRFFVRAESWL